MLIDPTHVQDGQATREQLLAAVANFDACRGAVELDDGAPPMEPDEPAWTRAMQAASASLDDADADRAVAGLVRAAAANPYDAQSRDLLMELCAAVPTG